MRGKTKAIECDAGEGRFAIHDNVLDVSIALEDSRTHFNLGENLRYCILGCALSP